jgi:spermidine synthase
MPRSLYLRAIVFVAGASAVGASCAGSRLLAPYYGAGLFLQSALLGIVLAAFATGSAWGGRAAPRGTSSVGLAGVMAAAGGWALLLPWIAHPLLSRLDPLGMRIAVLVAAVLLPGPILFLIGMALAFAVQIGLASAPKRPIHGASEPIGALVLGAAVAAVAVRPLLASLGLGRFLAGIGLLDLAAGALALPGAGISKIAVPLFSGLALLGAADLWKNPGSRADPAFGLVDVRQGDDAEIRVLELQDARYLLADGTIRAVVAPETWQSLHRAGVALDLLKHVFDAPGTLLVAGVRGGSVCKSFARDGWKVDACEADARLASTDSKWFGLRASEARLVHADARAFLRRHRGPYDLVVLDIFGDSGLPLHLMTQEFFAQVAAALRPGGVLALPVEAVGWDDVLVKSLAATLDQAFDEVVALPTSEPPNALGSIVLAASNRKLEVPDAALGSPREYFGDDYGHWFVVQSNHAWLNRFAPEKRLDLILTDDRNPADLWSERINRVARKELHEFFGPRGRSW